MPTNVSVERKRILRAYGATFSTPIPAKDPTAHPHGPRTRRKHPDLYFYADQYSNDANWQATITYGE